MLPRIATYLTIAAVLVVLLLSAGGQPATRRGAGSAGCAGRTGPRRGSAAGSAAQEHPFVLLGRRAADVSDRGLLVRAVGLRLRAVRRPAPRPGDSAAVRQALPGADCAKASSTAKRPSNCARRTTARWPRSSPPRSRKWGRTSVEVEQAILDSGERVTNQLRRHLRLFNGISQVAPLLGLLGTVMGMIMSFNAIAASAAEGQREMMAERHRPGADHDGRRHARRDSRPARVPVSSSAASISSDHEIDALGQQVVEIIASDLVREPQPTLESRLTSRTSHGLTAPDLQS